MALIKCNECGQMVSDLAEKCPKCGCPTKKEHVAPYNTNMAQQPVYYHGAKRKNNNIWLYAIIALLSVALAGSGFYFYIKNKQQEKDYQQKLVTDSIARDSIAKEEKARQESIEQSRSTTEKKKQQAVEKKVVTAAPQYYGQVSDPDGYTNIRRGPSTSYPIVRRYDSGDYLYYTPQNNGWSLVYSGVKANTFMGYMHTSRIVRVDPNRSDSYGYSGDNFRKGYIVDPVDNYVNIRKGPGINYAIVGRLDTYTDVYYTTTGSNWYKNYLGYIYHDRVR